MPTESNRCPHCNCAYCPVRTTKHKEINVTDHKTRTVQVKVVTVRERICNNCKMNFTSYEIPEDGKNPSVPDADIMAAIYELGTQTLKPRTPAPKKTQKVPLGKTTLKSTKEPVPETPYNPYLKD